MEDYKEIIKEMILRNFSATPTYRVIRMSSSQILQMVQGVIPPSPITQHDIFEAMHEMGFQYELNTPENDETNSYIYLWNLYKNY